MYNLQSKILYFRNLLKKYLIYDYFKFIIKIESIYIKNNFFILLNLIEKSS